MVGVGRGRSRGRSSRASRTVVMVAAVVTNEFQMSYLRKTPHAYTLQNIDGFHTFSFIMLVLTLEALRLLISKTPLFFPGF